MYIQFEDNKNNGGLKMERKIGEEFYFKNKKLKVTESDSCTCCYFNYVCSEEDQKICGECYILNRNDDKNVVFKEVENE